MRRWLVALTVATLTALLWLAWSGSAQSQAEMSFDEFVSKPQTYIGP
jgi:hypothetical protein